MNLKKIRKILWRCCLWGALGVFVLTAATNLGMFFSQREKITWVGDSFSDIDCILVLGCQVKADGVPSHMLEDRLLTGVNLYLAGAAPKLLMSGDHGQEDYNEVGTMKQFAIDAGIPSEDVFMDHAGFSTYESLYRAKHIFGAERIIIVTQKYHLYRALYIANALGMEAVGVECDRREYFGQFAREVREVLARVKDLFLGIFKPEPTYLGETIDLTGNGDITNDAPTQLSTTAPPT